MPFARLGFGLIPASASAAEFSHMLCASAHSRYTGVSGKYASRLRLSGIRSSVQFPINHPVPRIRFCPGCAFTYAAICSTHSCSEWQASSVLHTYSLAATAPVNIWVCASIKDGMTNLSPISYIGTSAGTAFVSSYGRSFLILSSLIQTASGLQLSALPSNTARLFIIYSAISHAPFYSKLQIHRSGSPRSTT